MPDRIESIAVVGAGQMGLVLAEILAHNRSRVRLWGHDPHAVAELRRTRRNPHRLAGLTLPGPVLVTGDDAQALAGASLAVSAVPTQHIRSVWRRLAPRLDPGVPVVSVSKGLEIDTGQLPSAVLRSVLGPEHAICVLSGPAIAAELARHLPATLVAASENPGLARRVQGLFTAPWVRVYSLDDVLGVEVAGATKNVIALAAGMLDGLRAGYNAKGALLARGLAEIARLGTAMGARLDTFFGVAGVGDLATTCFSPDSRNRTCGERLARGETLDAILASTPSVVEGVPTTRVVVDLARAAGVDLPIAQVVRRILFEGLAPRDAVAELMRREPKEERVG
jgi:glycerol-3-phosphate dehydrogenase (NAD(P)+)